MSDDALAKEQGQDVDMRLHPASEIISNMIQYTGTAARSWNPVMSPVPYWIAMQPGKLTRNLSSGRQFISPRCIKENVVSDGHADARSLNSLRPSDLSMGSEAVREQGSEAARQPSSQGAREPGSHGAREPGSQGAGEPGSQGAREPRSQGAREPGQPRSQVADWLLGLFVGWLTSLSVLLTACLACLAGWYGTRVG